MFRQKAAICLEPCSFEPLSLTINLFSWKSSHWLLIL